jgi:hypothetical protein
MGQLDKIEGNVAVFDRNSPLRGAVRLRGRSHQAPHIVWKSPIA